MSTSAIVFEESLPAHGWPELKLRCPRCTANMESQTHGIDRAAERQRCPRCGATMQVIDGICRAILPGRASQLDVSMSAYEAVRDAEGRWSESAEFYLALPWQDTTGRFSQQWHIRGCSFDFLLKRLLPECVKMLGKQRLRVLDLGAGNCWMSYRLALNGHFPVAVDIGLGHKDGLSAAKHFHGALGRLFPRFQAEMSWLPFADDQFDLAIYNASFHYAQDYEATLREALRVLRPNGAILIVDSPTYRVEADGEAMKREKAVEFARKFGTDFGGMGGQQYLTPHRLARMEQIGIRWRRYSPWYGLRWALRPVAARLKGRRRPSQFHIYLGIKAPHGTEAQ